MSSVSSTLLWYISTWRVSCPSLAYNEKHKALWHCVVLCAIILAATPRAFPDLMDGFWHISTNKKHWKPLSANQLPSTHDPSGPLYDSLDDPALRTTSRREQSCRPANAAWTHRSRTLKFSHWQHKCIARLLDCSTSIWWSLGKLRTFDWLLCYGHNNSSITLGTLEGQHGDAFVTCCECNCLSVFCLSLQTLFGYLVSHSCIICSFVTAPLAAAKCIQTLRWSHMPRSSRTSISCFMCLNVFSVFEFFGHLHPSGF